MNHVIKEIYAYDESDTSSIVEDITFLPLAVNVNGLKCLVVGGGRVALRKVKTLLNAGALITIIAPDVHEELQDLVDNNTITWLSNEYQPKQITNYDFIIAATSDKVLNVRIGKDAKRLKKLYCIVSSGQHSQVIFPAIHSQDGIMLAVHSNGLNCRRSKQVRDDIARYLQGKHHLNEEFLVFGFKHCELPAEISRGLNHFARKADLQDSLSNTLIISTCQRWECYISSKTPRKDLRKIFSLLESKLNAEITQYLPNAYFRYDNAAYHHLLSILVGLDSPLIGETEIISQVRSAMSRYLSQTKNLLTGIFESTILASRKIRNSCGLEPTQISWADVVVSAILEKINIQKAPNVLIIGTGKLAESIINKCSQATMKIKSLSDRLEDTLLDVIVICSELSHGGFDLSDFKCSSGMIILDMEGNNDSLFKNNNNIRYYKAKDIAYRPIDNNLAGIIASARIKTIEQSLVRYGLTKKLSIPADELKIGTRASDLAIAQTDEFMRMLKSLAPEVSCSIETFNSPGDRDKITPLPKVKDDDFFTCDIDSALLSGKIDIALHSAKDMPQKIRNELYVAGVTPSIANWECLVSKSGLKLMELPAGSAVGISSERRRKQIEELRPDLKAVDIRGNVPNRIAQMNSGKYDALILAAVGLIRLGMQQHITEIFRESVFPSTQGQGSLAIVIREEDEQLRRFLKPLDLGNKEGLPWR